VIEEGATSLTTMLSVAVSVPAVLVAVTVYEVDDETALGVPLSSPVEVSNERPDGSDGEMAYESTSPA
jgi:hypothetical protein